MRGSPLPNSDLWVSVGVRPQLAGNRIKAVFCFCICVGLFCKLGGEIVIMDFNTSSEL